MEVTSERPLIGAHVSTAGGLYDCAARAKRIGAEAVQIFGSNPRIWHPYPRAEEEVEAFRGGLERYGLPLFIHSIYLINLASAGAEQRRRSAEALGHSLWLGAHLGARGVVTHVGSHQGRGFRRALPWIRETVERARARASTLLPAHKPLPLLLVEGSAGSTGSVGQDPAELAELVTLLGPDAGICLDTAHLFASGQPVHTPEGLDGLLEEMRALGCLDVLGLVHLNDSAHPFGSRRDKHADLWEGCIGRAALARLLRHPLLGEVPFVLEVPGAAGHGPDARNIRRAKIMRRRG